MIRAMRQRAILALQRMLRARYKKQIVELQDPFHDMKLLLAGWSVETIVDGGAYRGEITDRLLDVFPRARAVAFEPSGKAFRYLESKYAGSAAVLPVHAALSSSTGTRTLYDNAQETTNALSPVADGGRRYQSWQTENVATERITTTTLDDWLTNERDRKVELIKLDVQGHELHALRGAERTLRSTVRLVYAEVEFIRIYEENCLFHEIDAYLSGLGFELFQLYHLTSAHDRRLLTGDAIFIQPGRVAL